MDVSIVDIDKKEEIMSSDAGKDLFLVGDIMLLPNNRAYRVLQRSFIFERVTTGLVEIGRTPEIEAHIQILVQEVTPGTVEVKQ